MIIFYFFLAIAIGIVIGYFTFLYKEKRKNKCPWVETFNAINDPIAILSPEGKVEQTNKAMQDFLNKTPNLIANKYCHELIHDKKEHIDGCPLQRSLKSLKREEMEIEINNKYLLISVDPIIKNNNIKHFVYIIKDVTEIKKIEIMLKEETRKFETLVDNLPGFIYRCNNDHNWTMQYISQGCEVITGYKPEELILNVKLSFNDIIAPEYKEYLWNKWQDVLSRKGTFEDEYEIISKFGQRRWVWERGRGIFDEKGNLLFLEGFITDITEKKKIFNELLESEKKFRSLSETTTAAIFIYQENKFVFLNSACTNLTGYSNEELLNMNFWDLVHPDHQELVKERGQKRLSGEPQPTTYDFKIVRKDGEIRWVKFSGANISQYKGKPAAIATAFDITEMVDAQNKLQEIISQLEENERQLKVQNEEYISINEELKQTNQRIQRLNEELIKAKEKAEESDRLKSTFLNNISHEIRTPLNAILGFTELLQKRIQNDEKSIQYINIVQSSGKHLLNVITNIINTATIEAGEEKVHLEKIYLNKLIETVIQSLKPLLANKDVEIIFNRLDEKQAYILSDETKLNQIFINLINNAIKYTEKGKIEISVKIESELIKISIKDTGIGINKEVLPFIFERFIQVGDITKKHSASGMGLGLSIVKSYVNLMGGKISVHSELGKGTEFTIELPYLPLNIKSENLEKQTNIELNSERKTILVVEDITDNAELIKEYLLPYNFKLLFANNGIKAIELVKNNPDLNFVLLDIKMPEMDGYEVCKNIFKINPNLIIIGITAYNNEEETNKMKLYGMKAVLTKPLSKNVLIETLKKFII